MTGGPTFTAEIGREAFGTACGLAVVAGALAVLLPEFDGLVAALVALAFAAWASLHRRGAASSLRGGRPAVTYGLAFLPVVVGVGVFLDPPSTFAPWRGLALGSALLPLWWTDRAGGVARGRMARSR